MATENTEELKVEIEEGPSTNGVARNGGPDSSGYAGQSYPFLEREVGSNNFIAARELFHGSNKPTEYLPRTRIDEHEIGRSMRIVARYNRVTKGYSDRPSVTAWKYNARMGLSGKARSEVVRVATNQPYQDGQRGVGGMMNRARDVHPNQENK